nr:MAG TPA: hypothetical protein [Caudoviricetes sp.]
MADSFNYGEFAIIKSQAGFNIFNTSPKKCRKFTTKKVNQRKTSLVLLFGNFIF